MRSIDAWPGIADCHEDACMVLLGADLQLTRSRLLRAHCFDCVQDQVQDDLLQLNTIPLDGSQSLRKVGLDRDSILGNCASRQYDHLVDRLVKIKTAHSRRRFLDLVTDPIDDISGSIVICHDTLERLPDFAEVWRASV